VAAALGITPEHLSMLKKRGRLPLEQILDFCAARSISANWLLYDQDPKSLCESTDTFIYVRYFREVDASAGGGAFAYETLTERLLLDPKIVELLGGRSVIGRIEAINVAGESMEPTLKDGSIAFVDRGRKDIKQGGIFVVSTNYGLFIKRVILRLDGRIELASDNKEYGSELLMGDEVQIIGRVVGVVEPL